MSVVPFWILFIFEMSCGRNYLGVAGFWLLSQMGIYGSLLFLGGPASTTPPLTFPASFTKTCLANCQWSPYPFITIGQYRVQWAPTLFLQTMELFFFLYK